VFGSKHNRKAKQQVTKFKSRQLLSEVLEVRQMMAADAGTAWQQLQHQPLLGETVEVALQFNNNGTNAGYAPYVDLVVPRGQAADQGVQFVASSAAYLDSRLRETIVQFNSQGIAQHPLAKDINGKPLELHGNAGDQLVVLELPFGSFVSGQPAVQISMQLSVGQNAQLGESLAVVATSGFRLGNDALDNPAADAAIRGASTKLDIVPGLVRTTIQYLGPEDETATGANFLRSYRVNVDIAEGAAIDHLALSNLFDDKQAFLKLRDASWGESLVVNLEPKSGVVSDDAQLLLELREIVGRAGVDGSYIVDFFVPDFDTDGIWTADPILGTDSESKFQVQATGLWTQSEATETAAANQLTFSSVPATHVLDNQVIAVQKSVRLVADANVKGLGPSDILEYTIDFQVSDYASVIDLVLNTTVPDGQRLISEAPITFTISGVEGYSDRSVSKSLTGLNPLDSTKTTGRLNYLFNVSHELVARGLSGEISGGATERGLGNAVVGSITYRTIVLDQFEERVLSGDFSIDEGDKFTADVLASARTIDQDQNSTNHYATDSSATRQQLAIGALKTTVFAVNGVAASAGAAVKAGDLVTYRVTREVRGSDIEDLVLNNYLPLPIYQVSSLKWLGAEKENAANSLRFGPSDSFHEKFGIKPSIQISERDNLVSLKYGSVDSEANETTTIDLLLTVVVQDQPFADGMWLTTLARSEQGSSNNGDFAKTAITNVQYTRPVLALKKSAVSSSNPAATVTGEQGDTNISRVDAGDLVRFELVVQNTGLSSSGAFDIKLRDAMPAGFKTPTTGLQLSVTDGNGASIKYVGLENKLDGDLFGAGLQLLEPLANGLSIHGANKLVIAYDLQATGDVRASTATGSSAELLHYAAIPGGSNYVTTKITDDASVAFAVPVVEHVVVSTDQSHTAGNSVVIGETVTYRVRVAVPEVKMTGAMLQIDLPRGMAINKIEGLSVDADINLAQTDVQKALSEALILNTSSIDRDAGRILQVKLGDLTNTNRDNTRVEYIELVYSATVTNDLGNHGGNRRSNSATWIFDGKKATAVSSAVLLAEPRLLVTKSWSSGTVDASDQVVVTVDVRHHSTSGAAAFDASFVDSIPSGTTYVPGSFRWISGPLPVAQSDSNGFNASWDSIPMGSVSRLQYSIVVNDNVHAGERLTSQATVNWTSLGGTVGQIAKSNTLTVERTGNTSDVGGAANDYVGVLNAGITVSPVRVTMKLVSTSHDHTPGDQLTIGERATYSVSISIPEGVHSLDFNSLQKIAGSTLVPESMKLISIGENLKASGLKVGEVLTADNGQLRWKLGTITNVADNQATNADRLVFELTALVPNVSINEGGDRPEIVAEVDYRFGVASASSSVAVVEPALKIVQVTSKKSVDATDIVDAVITIEHHGGTSSAAFELNLEALSTAGLQLIPGSVKSNIGHVITGNDSADSSIRLEIAELSATQSIQVHYQLSVDKDVAPGTKLTASSQIKWQSLVGDEARFYSAKSSAVMNVNAIHLAGWVFVDANQDGVQQRNDHGLFDVPVTLVGLDHLGQEVRIPALTDPSGRFEFQGLRPGSYKLWETHPTEWSAGRDWIGTAGGTVTQDGIEVELKTGTDGLFDGYKFTQSPLTYISGTVFIDGDEDGRLGQDEDGLAGIEIGLTGVSDEGVTIERKTLTNSRGYYVFDHLPPGTYSLIQGETLGYFDAAEQLGNRGGRVDNDAFHEIKVTASKPGEMYNFGEYRPGSITGQIYIDYDRDLNLDRRDALLANVDVTLTGVNDLGQAIHQAVRTDEMGRYSFGDLRPGTYALDSAEVPNLEFEIANVGPFNGNYGSNAKNGYAVDYGFEGLRLPAGGNAVQYNIGHVDPTYDATIMERAFESETAIVGTNGNDSFTMSMTADKAVIRVGDKEFAFAANETRSFRLFGSFGNDSLDFFGSENKEEIDLRKHSARIKGTWFEVLVYGTEQIRFTGGGNEDLARFYDTELQDTFVASPFAATMSGLGYKNSVDGVHRIYGYATSGSDTAILSGAVDQRDNFSVKPGDAKLYGNDFYLYASGFDDVTGHATDATDRAYLYGSDEDDQLSAGQFRAIMQGKGYKSTAENYSYVIVAADQRGSDSAVLVGSDGDDWFRSRPSEATFDVGQTRIIAQDFENVRVEGRGGLDTAVVHDSHYQDTFTVAPGRASIVNRMSQVVMTSFESVSAYMLAGGEDQGFVTGSSGVDLFKASPGQWSMQGSGNYFFGAGFTKVTAYGSAEDTAYLYDSAFNDLLELASGSATLSGQLYSNSAIGFGKVNSEATTGDDRVVFMDDAKRSTFRLTEEKATIFGTGFSHNATGFDQFDAFYTALDGADNVELMGRIEFELSAVAVANAKYRLSLGFSENASALNLKTRVDRLSLS